MDVSLQSELLQHCQSWGKSYNRQEFLRDITFFKKEKREEKSTPAQLAVRKPVASGQCESFISFSEVASLVEGFYPSLIEELSDIIQSAFD